MKRGIGNNLLRQDYRKVHLKTKVGIDKMPAPIRPSRRIVRFTLIGVIFIVLIIFYSKSSQIQNEIPVLKMDPTIKPASALTPKPTIRPEIIIPNEIESKPKEGPVKATFVSLARNGDLYPLVNSIKQIEDRFNRKYKYDWVFLNEQPFTEEFKKTTSSLVSGQAKFGFIDEEQWSFPPWLDKEKAEKAREQMQKDNIIYGGSIPYRHMCRYESGFFWRHPLMNEYEYYWRVDPDIKIYCDINYDVFQWMHDNDKKYSFTISLPEYPETIPTLWDNTKKFIESNPQYLAKDNLMEFISFDNGINYNGCHFWSNFEIASLELWRSEAYRKYFDHLDQAGGFFYERWGDAPVHSIAACLFLRKDQIHFFDDMGYYHVPFNNCPFVPSVREKNKCYCNPNDDFTWKGYSCTSRFYRLTNRKKPEGYENYAD